MWERVRGMSGRGYGDYFGRIRSVRRQTGGECGLHGACSVGQYLGWMGRGARRGWRQMRRYVGRGGSFSVTQGDVGGCWVRRFVRPSLWWGFILSVCLSVIEASLPPTTVVDVERKAPTQLCRWVLASASYGNPFR